MGTHKAIWLKQP